MADLTRNKRRVMRISWLLACILALEAVVTVWLVLGGWPCNGWLRGFAPRFPVLTAVSAISFFSVLVYVNRPHPLPWWAMPDEGTVWSGIGLIVFVTLGVIVMAIGRISGR